jgi:hypothetical protein
MLGNRILVYGASGFCVKDRRHFYVPDVLALTTKISPVCVLAQAGEVHEGFAFTDFFRDLRVLRGGYFSTGNPE